MEIISSGIYGKTYYKDWMTYKFLFTKIREKLIYKHIHPFTIMCDIKFYFII